MQMHDVISLLCGSSRMVEWWEWCWVPNRINYSCYLWQTNGRPTEKRSHFFVYCFWWNFRRLLGFYLGRAVTGLQQQSVYALHLTLAVVVTMVGTLGSWFSAASVWAWVPSLLQNSSVSNISSLGGTVVMGPRQHHFLFSSSSPGGWCFPVINLFWHLQS